MMRSAFDMVSAWASVLATTKSTPCKPAVIMLLTALPPAPPTPNTVMRGLSSRMSGIFRLMVMVASSSLHGRHQRPAPAGPPPAAVIFRLRIWGPSEALAKPLPDAGEIAARSGHEVPLPLRFEMFEVGRLRVDQKAGRHGKSRALGRLRQPRYAERPADPHRPAENARREVRQPGELARPAGEDQMATPIGREQRSRKAVAHHFQDLFDTRLDDVHQGGARHELSGVALVFAD